MISLSIFYIILSGKTLRSQVGKAMTTIQDIADKLGISKGTVSKALNGASDISETLQKQILETAVEMGYTKLRRYKKPSIRLCVLIQKDNIEY